MTMIATRRMMLGVRRKGNQLVAIEAPAENFIVQQGMVRYQTISAASNLGRLILRP